jgi:hypothetical protein
LETLKQIIDTVPRAARGRAFPGLVIRAPAKRQIKLLTAILNLNKGRWDKRLRRQKANIKKQKVGIFFFIFAFLTFCPTLQPIAPRGLFRTSPDFFRIT